MTVELKRRRPRPAWRTKLDKAELDELIRTSEGRPPPSWKSRSDESERIESYNVISPNEKRKAWASMIERRKRLEWLKARLLENPSDSRSKTIVKNGGRRKYTDATASNAADYQSRRQSWHRRSMEDLAFRQKYAKGCSYVGCVLAPAAESTRASDVLFTLLEHDHIERQTKVACVTNLTGDARMKELEKTQVLCIWHHFLKTRDEIGREVDVVNNEKITVKVRCYKMSVGCQHPLHSTMSYASMIPIVQQDIKMSGFLHVTHVHRGVARQLKAEAQMEDIQNNKAVIYCKMCHSLYTLCQNAHVHPDSPLTQHQYQLLQVQTPAFVAHFEIANSEFDWSAERNRESALKIKARKRKREIANV